MNAAFPIMFFLLFAAVAVGAICLYFYFRKIRRQKLAMVANRLGFDYIPGGRFDFHHRFGGFELFQRGSGRHCYDLITGRDDSLHIDLFDYSYSTGSGKNRTTHRRTVCIVTLNGRCRFAYTRIRPENFLDKFASAVGFNDIDFESSEFSKKYFVKGKDRRFAYDLLHPRMMEYLLDVGAICVETGGRVVLVHPDRKLSPRDWPGLYYTAREFIERIPERLIQGDW